MRRSPRTCTSQPLCAGTSLIHSPRTIRDGRRGDDLVGSPVLMDGGEDVGHDVEGQCHVVVYALVHRDPLAVQDARLARDLEAEGHGSGKCDGDVAIGRVDRGSWQRKRRVHRQPGTYSGGTDGPVSLNPLAFRALRCLNLSHRVLEHGRNGLVPVGARHPVLRPPAEHPHAAVLHDVNLEAPTARERTKRSGL